jgi:hypothetical protein
VAEPVARSRRSGSGEDRDSRPELRPEREPRGASRQRGSEAGAGRGGFDERDRLYARGAYSGAYDFELDDPSLADELLDDLIPPEINWRRMVRRHPWPALAIAGLAGYLLGRSQGRALVGAIAGLAVARVEERVLGLVEDELEDD